MNAGNKNKKTVFTPSSLKARAIIFTDLLTLITAFSVLFIPIYTLHDSQGSKSYIFLNALYSGRANIGLVIGLVVSVAALAPAVALFIRALRHLNGDAKHLVRRSGISVLYDLGACALFFVIGIIATQFLNTGGKDVTSISYIPFLICSVLAVLNAYFRQLLYFPAEKKKNDILKKENSIRLIIIAFVLLFSILSAIAIIMDSVVIEMRVGDYAETIKLNGLTLISHPKDYGEGFQMLAFAESAMALTTVIAITLSLISFFSRSDDFATVSKTTIIINYVFIFAVSLFGKYYEIVQKANEENVISLFNRLDGELALPDYSLKISSPTFYILIAATAVAAVLIAIKPFSRLILCKADLPSVADRAPAAESAVDTGAPVQISDFDSCPVFTQADESIPSLLSLNKQRRERSFGQVSLPEIVKFIVDYARESRLQLSYTYDDIADFIAGLGATKLTILQGMSGTGKTSLPKIVSEALGWNCDIIEVESSWKDKNELIGYYNEFSRVFTPKKFTSSLYNAALDSDAVTFIVLDEMNLSRIEYYFSDFLSLMENEADKREIKLAGVRLTRVSGGKEYGYSLLENGNTLKVSPSIWFIGTANRDESTFGISDKVYDRAHTMNFTKRAAKARPMSSPLDPCYLSYNDFMQLIDGALKRFDFDCENSETVKQVERLLAPYNISFGNRVMNQIEVYVRLYCACMGGSDVQSKALEKILLSKMVSKLEFKNVPDKDALIAGFEKLEMHLCADFVRGLDEDSFYG